MLILKGIIYLPYNKIKRLMAFITFYFNKVNYFIISKTKKILSKINLFLVN